MARSRVQSVARGNDEKAKFHFYLTDGKYEGKYIVAIGKDGHLSIFDEHVEHFIYLYPSQVKDLKRLLAGRIKWDKSCGYEFGE